MIIIIIIKCEMLKQIHNNNKNSNKIKVVYSSNVYSNSNIS